MNLKLTIAICLGVLLMVAAVLRDDGAVDRIAEGGAPSPVEGSVVRVAIPPSGAGTSMPQPGASDVPDAGSDLPPFAGASPLPAASGALPVYQPQPVDVEVPQQVFDPQIAADSPIR